MEEERDIDMATAPQLWQALRVRILADMRENGASTEDFLSHKAINRYMDKQALSAVLKSLKDDGLATYSKGLWSDDGQMAGAGHALTAKGMAAAELQVKP